MIQKASGFLIKLFQTGLPLTVKYQSDDIDHPA
jgi:hypothetical protein